MAHNTDQPVCTTVNRDVVRLCDAAMPGGGARFREDIKSTLLRTDSQCLTLPGSHRTTCIDLMTSLFDKPRLPIVSRSRNPMLLSPRFWSQYAQDSEPQMSDASRATSLRNHLLRYRYATRWGVRILDPRRLATWIYSAADAIIEDVATAEQRLWILPLLLNRIAAGSIKQAVIDVRDVPCDHYHFYTYADDWAHTLVLDPSAGQFFRQWFEMSPHRNAINVDMSKKVATVFGLSELDATSLEKSFENGDIFDVSQATLLKVIEEVRDHTIARGASRPALDVIDEVGQIIDCADAVSQFSPKAELPGQYVFSADDVRIIHHELRGLLAPLEFSAQSPLIEVEHERSAPSSGLTLSHNGVAFAVESTDGGAKVSVGDKVITCKKNSMNARILDALIRSKGGCLTRDEMVEALGKSPRNSKDIKAASKSVERLKEFLIREDHPILIDTLGCGGYRLVLLSSLLSDTV